MCAVVTIHVGDGQGFLIVNFYNEVRIINDDEDEETDGSENVASEKAEEPAGQALISPEPTDGSEKTEE